MSATEIVTRSVARLQNSLTVVPLLSRVSNSVARLSSLGALNSVSSRNRRIASTGDSPLREAAAHQPERSNLRQNLLVAETVVVFAGGPGPLPRIAIPLGATLIAADGGLELASDLGLEVDLAVGDFDSVAETKLEGVPSERHPAAKDATDLELALATALELGPRRLVVVGSAGGRLDHLLGGLLLLAADAYRDCVVDAQLGSAVVHVVHGTRELEGMRGELISLFALGGDAHGVATEGLVYPLRGEMLAVSSTRGVSNEFAEAVARISVRDGVLLAVRPDATLELAGPAARG